MNQKFTAGDDARRLSILGFLQEEKICVQLEFEQEAAHSYFRENYLEFYGQSVVSSHLRNNKDNIAPIVLITKIDEQEKLITFTKVQHWPKDGYMPNMFEMDMVVADVVIPLSLITGITVLHGPAIHKARRCSLGD